MALRLLVIGQRQILLGLAVLDSYDRVWENQQVLLIFFVVILSISLAVFVEIFLCSCLTRPLALLISPAIFLNISPGDFLFVRGGLGSGCRICFATWRIIFAGIAFRRRLCAEWRLGLWGRGVRAGRGVFVQRRFRLSLAPLRRTFFEGDLLFGLGVGKVVHFDDNGVRGEGVVERGGSRSLEGPVQRVLQRKLVVLAGFGLEGCPVVPRQRQRLGPRVELGGSEGLAESVAPFVVGEEDRVLDRVFRDGLEVEVSLVGLHVYIFGVVESRGRGFGLAFASGLTRLCLRGLLRPARRDLRPSRDDLLVLGFTRELLQSLLLRRIEIFVFIFITRSLALLSIDVGFDVCLFLLSGFSWGGCFALIALSLIWSGALDVQQVRLLLLRKLDLSYGRLLRRDKWMLSFPNSFCQVLALNSFKKVRIRGGAILEGSDGGGGLGLEIEGLAELVDRFVAPVDPVTVE